MRWPGNRVTIAFFQPARDRRSGPPRRIARDRLDPLTFSVLTALTRTLKVFSTASRIWILFGRWSDLKRVLVVLHQVGVLLGDQRLTMICSMVSAGTLGLPCAARAAAGAPSGLLPGARLPVRFA